MFTVEFLNNRIATFRYGPQEAKNKPSPNFDTVQNSKINYNQKAIQSWLLLRSLPFLIGHCVTEEGAEHMYLLLLLLKIVEISFATEINEYMLCELSEYTIVHEQLFLKLFPNQNHINKHHHIHHYVDLIKKNGPLINYCCLSYESKFSELKRLCQISMNYKNLPFSISKRQAYLQNKNISEQKYALKSFDIISSKLVKTALCLSKPYIDEYHPNDILEVKKIACVKINRVTYQPNYILVLDNDDDETSIFPKFFKIVEIINVSDDFYFYGNLLETQSFNEFLNAYELENTQTMQFLNINELHLIFKPLSIWYTLNSPSKEFIARKQYY